MGYFIPFLENNPLHGFLVLKGYEGVNWIHPESDRYYWLGYALLNLN